LVLLVPLLLYLLLVLTMNHLIQLLYYFIRLIHLALRLVLHLLFLLPVILGLIVVLFDSNNDVLPSVVNLNFLVHRWLFIKFNIFNLEMLWNNKLVSNKFIKTMLYVISTRDICLPNKFRICSYFNVKCEFSCIKDESSLVKSLTH